MHSCQIIINFIYNFSGASIVYIRPLFACILYSLIIQSSIGSVCVHMHVHVFMYIQDDAHTYILLLNHRG